MRGGVRPKSGRGERPCLHTTFLYPTLDKFGHTALRNKEQLAGIKAKKLIPILIERDPGDAYD